MRRLLLVATVVVGLATPASLVVVALSPGTAWASSSVTCKKLSGSVTSNTITISKCSPKNKEDKTATGSVTTLESGSGTITWSPSGGTTNVAVSFSQAATNECGKNTEYVISGSVTSGGTSTYTNSGDTISADVCVTSSFSFSLLKKTVMDL